MFKLIVLVLAHRLPSNGIRPPPPPQHLTQWGSGERLGWVQKTLAGWTCITQSFLDGYTGCRWTVFQITTSWGQYLPLQQAPGEPPTLPPCTQTAPPGPLCKAAVSTATYVWCTSESQEPYSSHGSTALHRHWSWNKTRPLSPAMLPSQRVKLSERSWKATLLLPHSSGLERALRILRMSNPKLSKWKD